jgi:hypothetical protein
VKKLALCIALSAVFVSTLWAVGIQEYKGKKYISGVYGGRYAAAYAAVGCQFHYFRIFKAVAVNNFNGDMMRSRLERNGLFPFFV